MSNMISKEQFLEMKRLKELGVPRVVYGLTDLVANIDFDILTGEDKEKQAEAILLQLLTSQDVQDNIDDRIDEHCLDAVKSYLSVVKSELKKTKILLTKD